MTEPDPVADSFEEAGTVLGLMAGIALLLGACAAVAADDVKRVLAWSTVSQLGYMMAALSARAPDAAMFHLFTHAAFKALLFLCAGSLIHAVGSNLLTRMGGLRAQMPLTFVTMTIGWAALVGVPPMAGFFSKESVLSSLHEKPWLYTVALIGVGLTAWYSTRAWWLAFYGPNHAHGHEPALSMRFPLVLLAIPAAGLGLGAYLVRNNLLELDGSIALPVAVMAVGAIVGWLMCRRGDPIPRLGAAGRWIAGGFGLDTVQRWIVVLPVRGIAWVAKTVDVSGVDGAVMGLGRLTTHEGEALASWHRAALPRALAGVLAGAVVLAAAGLTLSLVGLW